MTTGPELDRKLLVAVERLGRALRAARQQLASRHRLSLLQLLIVEHLADGRPRRVGELAAELDVTQPTVSEALGTLQNKGLANRRGDEGDARVNLVTLTTNGSVLAAEIADELVPILTANPSTNAGDRAIALRVVLAEISHLQKAGVISINRSCLTCLHYQQPAAAPAPTPTEARCLLLDEPLRDADLRVDCADYVPEMRGQATHAR